MKLIFFGGCFDPPHKGHYEIIKKCSKECHRFLIIPTLNSPLKNKISTTPAHHILEMLTLLIQGINQSIEIDEFDFTRCGPSYTIETIHYLKQKYPEYSISMVMGVDQLIKFQQWKDYNEIMNSVHIIIFNRDGYIFTPLPEMSFTWVEDFKMDISSEKIKADIETGELNKNALSHNIVNYIMENNLYGDI